MHLHQLPDDVLTKIFRAFVAHCDGLPFVWRLVCRELRHAARAHSLTGSLQLLGVSAALVRMVRAWLRCAHNAPFRKITFAGKPSGKVREDDLVRAVVAYNNVPVFEELLQDAWVRDLNMIKHPTRYNASGLTFHASCNGALDILKVLVNMRHCVGPQTCEAAVQHGHADVVAWHLNLQRTLDDCGARRHRHTLDFPHPTDPARNCAMDLFKQLYELSAEYAHLLKRAVRHGHLHILEMLIPFAAAEGELSFHELAKTAAEFGQLAILMWVFARLDARADDFEDCVCDVLFEACFHGHLEMLKWLWLEHVSWVDHRMAYANNAHDLELTRWLVEETGMPLSPSTMMEAMDAFDRTRNFEVMDYLHSKNCPRFSPDPNAPHSGEGPVFATVGEYESAVATSDVVSHQLVQWLHDHGYAVPAREHQHAMQLAIKRDDVAMVVKLISVGFAFQPERCGGADHCKPGRANEPSWEHRAVVKWARANGYEIPAHKRARRALSR